MHCFVLHVRMQTTQFTLTSPTRIGGKGREGDTLGNRSKRKEEDKLLFKGAQVGTCLVVRRTG